MDESVQRLDRELKECEKNLWKKESDEPSAIYVDLFKVTANVYRYGKPNGRASDGKCEYMANLHRSQGNAMFGPKACLWALGKYNESLRYAEFNGRAMALAYANRASCFLQLEHYDFCLADIELAIKWKYPQHLMPKLEQRKAVCMAKRARCNFVEPKLELSYPPNPSIPCMADALEIRQNDEFGRHIVAKSDIPAGKTILVEPNFLADSNYVGVATCLTCKRATGNLMPCENCTVAMFCSDECVERSRAYHDVECGWMFFDHQNTDTIQYLMRSVFIAINACGSVDELMAFVERVRSEPAAIPTSMNEPKERYRAFLQLHVHKKPCLNGHAAKRWVAYRDIMNVPEIKEWFDTLAKQRFLVHLIVMHDMIILDNHLVEKVCGNTFFTMGLVASMFNHQCAPNTVYCDVDGKIVVLTVRPVKKGDQLFLSYASDRQQIFDTHGFWCECSKCVPVAVPLNALLAMEVELVGISRHKPVTRKNQALLKVLKEKCVNFMNAYGVLPYNDAFERGVSLFHDCIKIEFAYTPKCPCCRNAL